VFICQEFSYKLTKFDIICAYIAYNRKIDTRYCGGPFLVLDLDEFCFIFVQHPVFVGFHLIPKKPLQDELERIKFRFLKKIEEALLFGGEPKQGKDKKEKHLQGIC
jgi:hypothetical protein